MFIWTALTFTKVIFQLDAFTVGCFLQPWLQSDNIGSAAYAPFTRQHSLQHLVAQ